MTFDDKTLANLLDEGENECVEFKETNCKPDEIGKYISAISNSACYLGKEGGYLIFGVNDSKKVVGTDFILKTKRKGKEELKRWLYDHITPKINFEFIHLDCHDENNNHIEAISIVATDLGPVSFKNEYWIRISQTQTTDKLENYPHIKANILKKSKSLHAKYIPVNHQGSNIYYNDRKGKTPTENDRFFIKLNFILQSNIDICIRRIVLIPNCNATLVDSRFMVNGNEVSVTEPLRIIISHSEECDIKISQTFWCRYTASDKYKIYSNSIVQVLFQLTSANWDGIKEFQVEGELKGLGTFDIKDCILSEVNSTK